MPVARVTIHLDVPLCLPGLLPALLPQDVQDVEAGVGGEQQHGSLSNRSEGTNNQQSGQELTFDGIIEYETCIWSQG